MTRTSYFGLNYPLHSSTLMRALVKHNSSSSDQPDPSVLRATQLSPTSLRALQVEIKSIALFLARYVRGDVGRVQGLNNDDAASALASLRMLGSKSLDDDEASQLLQIVSITWPVIIKHDYLESEKVAATSGNPELDIEFLRELEMYLRSLS